MCSSSLIPSSLYCFWKENGGYQGLERGGNWELLFNMYRVSVWEDEKAQEMDGGDGHKTMWMYLMLLNC